MNEPVQTKEQIQAEEYMYTFIASMNKFLSYLKDEDLPKSLTLKEEVYDALVDSRKSDRRFVLVEGEIHPKAEADKKYSSDFGLMYHGYFIKLKRSEPTGVDPDGT